MNPLEKRLLKLESSLLPAELIRIRRFIVNTDHAPVNGYRCGDVEIIRLPGEDSKSFHLRCNAAVDWTSTNRHVFDIIDSVNS